MDLSLLLMIFLAVVAALFVASRFAGNRFGALRINPDVGKAFEKGQINERLRYYISGPDNGPFAIMGLDRDWDLEEGLWKPRDLTSSQMQELVSGMGERMATLHGFDMVDDRGSKIGEWFSVLEIQTTITLRGGNRIAVATPPVETYLVP